MKASPQTTALIQGTGFYPSERDQPFYVQKVAHTQKSAPRRGEVFEHKIATNHRKNVKL